MANNVYKFRRIKWGDPTPKLKVLVEDFQRRVWLDRISLTAFCGLVIALCIAAFALVAFATTR